MKSQLLEDIGDSQPAPPGVRSSAAPPPRPSPDPAVRPRVWRRRHAAAAPEPAPPVEPAPPLDAPTEPHFFEPPPVIASFASQQPDLHIHLPEEPAPWMDRWGRKFFGWTLAAALVAGVAGAGWWLYGDTQVESTLALVAGQTPPAAPAPAPAPPAPLEQAARVGGPANTVELADAGSAPEPAPESAPASPPAAVPASAPEAPAPAATVEPPAPDLRAATAAAAPKPKKKTAAPAARRDVEKKRTPARIAPRREPPPARVAAQQPAPRAEAEPAGDALAETLRQCRAAGYHATLCIKRGCTATKFGLACRG